MIKPQRTRSNSESLRNWIFFNVTLGTWNAAPIDLELNDDAKRVFSRPYPVPRVHKEIFRKEIERLVKLGVILEANDS